MSASSGCQVILANTRSGETLRKLTCLTLTENTMTPGVSSATLLRISRMSLPP